MPSTNDLRMESPENVRYHTLRNYKRMNKETNVITRSVTTNKRTKKRTLLHAPFLQTAHTCYYTALSCVKTTPIPALTPAVHGLYL